MDVSISNFRVVGRYFSFYSNFDRTFCKKTAKTPDQMLQMQQSAASGTKVIKLFSCSTEHEISTAHKN